MNRWIRFCSVLCCLVLCAASGAVSRPAFAADSAKILQSAVDGVVTFKLRETGASSVQQWIDGDLCAHAGQTAEWYVLALRQRERGEYFSKYAKALDAYVRQNGATGEVVRERYALLFAATGTNKAYIRETIDVSTGALGIMSWVFSLHLLNNGYTGKTWTAEKVKDQLLGLQLDDGGWALNGTAGDVDVTAMTVQSLAPFYKRDKAVTAAVERALSLLSARQLASGGFMSYGTENPESAAQVLTALSALRIGLQDSRFVKSGKTVLDGILQFRLSDGSFSHTRDGEYNHNATVQAFYSMVAAQRHLAGKGSLYLFSAQAVKPTATKATTTKTTAATKAATGTTAQPPSVTAQNGQTTALQTTTAGTTAAAGVTDPSTTTSATSTEATAQPPHGTTSGEQTTKEALTDGTTVSAEEQTAPQAKRHAYKPWAIGGIWVLALLTGLVLFLLKKRSPKNFLALLLIAALLTGLVFVTDIERPSEYYGATTSAAAQTITVSFSITCDTVLGKSERTDIPKDGIILPPTDLQVPENATVYDCLLQVSKTYQIPFENDAQTGNSYKNAYIKGINYLYVFDFGELSGWMYFVNGVSAPVGCGEYTVSDGDVIEWKYTCALGEDLK